MFKSCLTHHYTSSFSTFTLWYDMKSSSVVLLVFVCLLTNLLAVTAQSGFNGTCISRKKFTYKCNTCFCMDDGKCALCTLMVCSSSGN